jgi:hypothetical protein
MSRERPPEGKRMMFPRPKARRAQGSITKNSKNRLKLKATHRSDPSRPKSKGIGLLDESTQGMGQRLRKLLDQLPK